jgi:aspartyl-tRNA(Asn)/glutamyl-tRNA(Gln) amidotransferase subunit A
LAIHLQELQARPDDFGLDFVARTVPACLFQASDYVNAQRERGRMIAEMDVLYRDFDVLLTATSSPAPRLDSLVDTGYLERWRTPNIYCQFNIAGGPALSVCSGFTAGGLPLGMQIAGRPFGEMTVLRVADAYERATDWHRRRPPAPASPEPLFPSSAETVTAASSPLQGLVDANLARAGILLSGRRLELVHRIAPSALAVADRLRRRREPSDEPADVHCFTDRLVDGLP